MLDKLKAVVSKASAIHLVTHLEADDAGAERPDGSKTPSIVAPAIYPGRPPGPNINALIAGDEVELWTVLDSVASQANRCEDALDAFIHDRSDIPFPALDIKVNDVLLSGIQAPHRVADAYFRVTNKAEYVAEVTRMALGQLRYEDNLTLALERFPTSLVFGSWAASTNALARIARIYRSNIDGITRIARSVYEQRKEEAILVRGRAMRRDPWLGGTSPDPLYPLPTKLDPKGWTFDKSAADKKELAKIESDKKAGSGDKDSEKNPFSLASHGLGDILAKDLTIRGVRIDYAVQNSVISLSGLRGFHFPDQMGKVLSDRDLASRAYLVALALLAHELAAERGYFLRSGCSLRPTRVIRQVVDTDGRSPLPWDATSKSRVDIAIELYCLAVADLKKQGILLAERSIAIADDKLVQLLRNNAKSTKAAENENG